jgi:large subunit ribosomal protein L25
MANAPVIEATSRQASGKGAARAARREGLVPGVVYGDKQDPVAINIKYNDLIRALKAGRFLSTLIKLKVDGKENRVICRAVQRDVVKDLPIHADFLRLSETARIALFIAVEFINRADCPGLRQGGVLTVVRSEVELKVPASDIPDHVTVDLAGLEIGDVVKISNVELPAGITPTITDRDFVIANISAPSALIAEEEEEAEEGEELEGAEGEEEEAEGEEESSEEE